MDESEASTSKKPGPKPKNKKIVALDAVSMDFSQESIDTSLNVEAVRGI